MFCIHSVVLGVRAFAYLSPQQQRQLLSSTQHPTQHVLSISKRSPIRRVGKGMLCHHTPTRPHTRTPHHHTVLLYMVYDVIISDDAKAPALPMLGIVAFFILKGKPLINSYKQCTYIHMCTYMIHCGEEN